MRTKFYVCETCGNFVQMIRESGAPMSCCGKNMIERIAIETEKGVQRTELVPGQAPSADFLLTEGDRVKAVYAYCNLHKLWKAEA